MCEMILQGPFVSTPQQLPQTPPITITASQSPPAAAAVVASLSPSSLLPLPPSRHPPCAVPSAVTPRRAPALCSGEPPRSLLQVSVKQKPTRYTQPPPQLKCNDSVSIVSAENSKNNSASSVAALVIGNSQSRSTVGTVELRSIASLDRGLKQEQSCSSHATAAATTVLLTTGGNNFCDIENNQNRSCNSSSGIAISISSSGGGVTGVTSSGAGGGGLVSTDEHINISTCSSSSSSGSGSPPAAASGEDSGSNCSSSAAAAAVIITGASDNSGASGSGSNVNLTPPNGFSGAFGSLTLTSPASSAMNGFGVLTSTGAASPGSMNGTVAAAAGISANGAAANGSVVTGKNPQMCSECCKVFTSSSALAKHKLTHSDERRYSCNLCHKRFKRQDHLNGHKLTHSATKPFVCNEPDCGKSYCDQRQLKRHLTNQHGIHDVDYSQLRKSKLFSSCANSTLVTLQGSNGTDAQVFALTPNDESSTASNEKESICPVCNKTFPTLPALNGHMRLHGGYDKEGKEQAFREKVLRNVHQQQPQIIDSPPSVGSANFSANVAAATLCAASAAVNLSQGSPSNGGLASQVATTGGAGSNSSSSVSSPVQPLALTMPHKTSNPSAHILSTVNAPTQASHLLDATEMNRSSLISALREAVIASQGVTSLPPSTVSHISLPMAASSDVLQSISSCFNPTASEKLSSTLNVLNMVKQTGVVDTVTAAAGTPLSFIPPTVPPLSSKGTSKTPFMAENLAGPPSYQNQSNSSVSEIKKEMAVPVLKIENSMKTYMSPSCGDLANYPSPVCDPRTPPPSAGNVSSRFLTVPQSNSHANERSNSCFSIEGDEKLSISQPQSIKKIESLRQSYPTQSALKSPYAVKSPGPSKSVHFVFPPPVANGENVYGSCNDLDNSRRDVKMFGNNASNDTCHASMHKNISVPQPPPYNECVESRYNSRVYPDSSGFHTPSAIPRHLQDAAKATDPLSIRNRSYSVDERALHPKPDIDEFLNVCDEFIAGELEKMNQRQYSLASDTTPLQGRPLDISSKHMSVKQNRENQEKPMEYSVQTQMRPSVSVTETNELQDFCDDIDDDDDDAFLPPGEVAPPTSCVSKAPGHMSISSRLRATCPKPLIIPKSANNFESNSFLHPSQGYTANGGKFTAQYYQHCLSASFAVDKNDNSLFKFDPAMEVPRSREYSISSQATATNGLLTPDRLDELFPDEPILRRNSVATFPCRLDDERVTSSNEVPISTPAISSQHCAAQYSDSTTLENKLLHNAQVSSICNSAIRRHSTSEVTVSPSKLSNNLSPPGVFKIPGSIAPSVMTAQPWNKMSGSNYDKTESNSPPSNMRRSFKPKPLHIPKHISTGVFRSCLKSPRLSVGMEPPPYTPPPMLTPKRSGPGLFVGSFPNIPVENCQLKRSNRSGSFSADVNNINEPELEPKINVGTTFQAALPELQSFSSADDIEDRAILVWAPTFDSSSNDLEIDQYLSAANSCCVNGGGGNTELAFHALAKAGGSVKLAMKQLLARKQRVFFNDPLEDYHYQNSAYWSTEERKLFDKNWNIHGKDFIRIKANLPEKTLKEVVEYYYSWKLVCRKEYQRSISENTLDIAEGAENCATNRHLSGSPQKHRYPSTSSNSSGGGGSCAGLASFKRRKLSCQCEGCYMQFDSISLLNEHVRSCHVGLSSSAQLQSNVTSVSSLDAHGSVVQQDSVNNVNRHMGSNDNVNFISSSGLCSNNNRVVSALQSEVARHTVKSNVPSICSEDNSDTSPVSAYGHFPCEVCGKIFTKVKSRNAHMKMHRQQTSDSSVAVNSISSPAKMYSVPTISHSSPSPMGENVSRLGPPPPPPVHVPMSQSNLSGIPTVHRSSTPQVAPTFQNEATAAAFMGGAGSVFSAPTPQHQQINASNAPGLATPAMHIQTMDTSMGDYQNVCINKTPSFNELETNSYPIPVGAIVLSAGADANNHAGEFSHLRPSDTSLAVSSMQGTAAPPISNQMYPNYQLPYSTQMGQSSAVAAAPQHQNPHQLAPPPQVHVIDMSGPNSFPDAYQIHSSIFRR